MNNQQLTIYIDKNPVITDNKITDNTEKKYPYRNLSKSEIDLLIILYDKYHGNMSAVSRDPESDFSSLPQLYHYKNQYKLDEKLEDFRIEKIRIFRENSLNRLSHAKLRVIERAEELLHDREIDLVQKDGSVVVVVVKPTAKDIVTAYHIIKTELGEPININSKDSLPINQDDVKKLQNIEVKFKDYGPKNKPK